MTRNQLELVGPAPGIKAPGPRKSMSSASSLGHGADFHAGSLLQAIFHSVAKGQNGIEQELRERIEGHGQWTFVGLFLTVVAASPLVLFFWDRVFGRGRQRRFGHEFERRLRRRRYREGYASGPELELAREHIHRRHSGHRSHSHSDHDEGNHHRRQRRSPPALPHSLSQSQLPFAPPRRNSSPAGERERESGSGHGCPAKVSDGKARAGSYSSWFFGWPGETDILKT